MMRKSLRWIFGGLLPLSGLLVPMAGFAEEEPVPYARNYILGPVFVSTSDTRRDRLEWDLLFPLVHHRSDHESSHTRGAQIYWSAEDRESGRSNVDILSFYGSSDGPTGASQFLLPLCGRADDSAANIHRFAMLGLRPSKELYKSPTRSLFEQVASPEEHGHRLCSLYRYRHGLANDETDFDALLLYRHGRDEAHTVDHLFPLYGSHSESSGDGRSSAIGLPPLSRSTVWSLYEHATFPTTVTDRPFPLYQDSRDGRKEQSTINVLGPEPASHFRFHRSLLENSPHAFPITRYQAGYHKGTYSLSEALLIIGVHVVFAILSPNCESNKPRYLGKPFDFRCDR